jgi:uncharacterized membrane protein YeiH
MIRGNFELPLAFDIGATAAFAITGAFAGVRRGYDIVGVFFLSAATALGGGLIRDGIFLNQGVPVAIRNPAYITTVAVACIAGLVLSSRMRRFERWIAVGDALGLGAYSVVGVQMTLRAGLGVPDALLIGVLNATGGGLLRDVLSREEPYVFKPGEFYVLVALAGEVCFVFMITVLRMDLRSAGAVAVVLTIVFRYLTVRFKWRTRAFAPPSQ